MRRVLLPLLALLLVASAVALAACGGDDDNSNNNADSSQPSLSVQPGGAEAVTGPTDQGTTDQSGGKSKKSKKKGSSGDGSSGAQEPGQQQASGGGKKKEKIDKALAESVSVKGQDKVSYEAARKVCREQSIKALKALYKTKGKSDEAIAKAVGKQYYPKHRAKAAAAGCLKGLSER